MLTSTPGVTFLDVAHPKLSTAGKFGHFNCESRGLRWGCYWEVLCQGFFFLLLLFYPQIRGVGEQFALPPNAGFSVENLDFFCSLQMGLLIQEMTLKKGTVG